MAPRPRATQAMAWSRLAASVCRYFSVVAMFAWPRSAWTSRREAPLFSACVAKVWRGLGRAQFLKNSIGSLQQELPVGNYPEEAHDVELPPCTLVHSPADP